jgi:hypothetical protein
MVDLEDLSGWRSMNAEYRSYGLPWIGHVAFEGNRPASVRHPLYSLADDFAMFKDMVLGRLPW